MLLIQIITSRVSAGLRESIDLEGIEKGVRDFGENEELFGESEEELKELNNSELSECLRVLDRVSELGLKRLRPDLIDSDERGSEGSIRELDELELGCLKRVILENADVFDALCRNIEKQVEGFKNDDDLGMAITVRNEDKGRVDDDGKVLRLIPRSVQIAHLDAMNECLKESDEDRVVSHIRFLHLDYEVEETEYR